MIRTFFATLCLLSSTSAFAAESIVGAWAKTQAECNSAKRVVVGPLFLGQDDFGCEFSTVSRDGNVVIWKGYCGYGDSTQGGWVPDTIIATLTAKRELTVLSARSGKSFNNLVRCSK